MISDIIADDSRLMFGTQYLVCDPRAYALCFSPWTLPDRVKHPLSNSKALTYESNESRFKDLSQFAAEFRFDARQSASLSFLGGVYSKPSADTNVLNAGMSIKSLKLHRLSI